MQSVQSGYYYLNRIYSEEDIQFLKDNYLQMTNAEMAEKLNRTEYAIEQRLRVLDLYRPTEIRKDGYKDLIVYMRSRLTPWRNVIMKECGYTCALTGKVRNVNLHHIYGFNLLFEETCEILSFPIYEKLTDYTDDELNLFANTFLNLQESYHAYVVVSEDVHMLFHKIYGRGNNTSEQWNEFVERFKNHYYDNVA